MDRQASGRTYGRTYQKAQTNLMQDQRQKDPKMDRKAEISYWTYSKWRTEEQSQIQTDRCTKRPCAISMADGGGRKRDKWVNRWI